MISESDFTLYGNQTRNAVCDIFREIGFCDFPRNWSRGSSLDMSRADILSPRPRFLSPFRNNSAAPTSPQQVGRVAIHGLILESVRKRWKIDEWKIPSVSCELIVARVGQSLGGRAEGSAAFAQRPSREYASAPSLYGSPSPPWFTFSYSTESAGRRCTSRLSAPLGRRAAFSYRLVVARFSAFLNIDFTLDCVALEKSPFGSGLSYRISGNRWFVDRITCL